MTHGRHRGLTAGNTYFTGHPGFEMESEPTFWVTHGRHRELSIGKSHFAGNSGFELGTGPTF